jgi:putative transposase
MNLPQDLESFWPLTPGLFLFSAGRVEHRKKDFAGFIDGLLRSGAWSWTTPVFCEPAGKEAKAMSDDENSRTHERWARLRFSIVGPLLAAPPARGQLQSELQRLAAKQWRHPITGQPIRFGLSTIQRWYYASRSEKMDPVGVLRRKIRKDAGQQSSLNADLRRILEKQYEAHKQWSHQLHCDNLRVVVGENPAWGRMPSYSSIRRYMKSRGLIRRKVASRKTPGVERAEARLQTREVRSFESEYVGGLWHLDFHSGSLKILTEEAEWIQPVLLAIMDDHSRLVCHAQWYLRETAENLVHGLGQAFLKRGLPRSLMTDNGSAMIAGETRKGLQRLGIVHALTLPYSPHQNGKQESFWGQVEGRLLAMMDNLADLKLPFLNEATQAWIEMEYQRAIHSEIGEAPLQRFLDSPQVSREGPAMDDLRLAFCQSTSRKQRRSDGTISLRGTRFEIPSRFRHFSRIDVRYACWDLSHVYLEDPRSGKVLARLYPLDRARNADSLRRAFEPVADSAHDKPEIPRKTEMAPLLRQLLQEYSATGLPPAYLPKIASQEDS